MRPNYLLATSILLLCSCDSKPLTDSECRTLAEDEIEFAVSEFPRDDAHSLRAALSESIDAGIRRCTSGKTYNRGDYKCMVSANNPSEIGKCIDEANRHIRH
jgi:hypothetical protein